MNQENMLFRPEPANPMPTDLSRHYLVDHDLPGDRSGAGGITPFAILHALRRRWLLGLVLGVLLAGPCAVISWSIHKLEFKAKSLVRVSPQHVPLLFETADRPGGTPGRLDFKSYKNTQRQLLLSPALLNNALKKNGISDLAIIRSQADPIAWLQKELEITFPDEAEIMHVSLSSTDANVAKKLVDAVVGTYYEEVVVAEQNDRLKRVDNLERVETEAENKARAKRAELRNLVDLLGTSDASALNIAQQAAVQQYSMVRSELMKIQFELMRAENDLQFHTRSAPNTLTNTQTEDATSAVKQTSSTDATPEDGQFAPAVDYRVAQLMASDPMGARYTREVERLSNLIQETENRLAPGVAAPHVERYREQLEHAIRRVSERTTEIQEQVRQTGGTSARDIPSTNLPREVEVLKAQESRLQEELKRLETESKKIGRSSIDVDMMLTEVTGLDKVVARITDELERTKIELKSNSRVTVLGPAQVPLVGASKLRLPLTAAAGAVGLLAPLLLLLAFDLRRQYVNGSRTICESTTVPILGSLPFVPRKIMRKLAHGEGAGTHIWRQRLAESVAAVTSLLLRKLELEGHRVVLITSAVSGEGKSTLAEQLASSLADSGHRTLLIDFDLRRPTMHQRFDVPLEPGVSELMRRGIDLRQVIHQSDTPNLSILTAGSCPGSLLQDAASGTIKSLFSAVRSQYEFVIVDSCPLLPVMDGRLLGQYVDGAILSVIKDVSQLPQFNTARSIMSEFGIPAVGCVVTGDNSSEYYTPYIRHGVVELQPA